jgi:hypothetical protein
MRRSSEKPQGSLSAPIHMALCLLFSLFAATGAHAADVRVATVSGSTGESVDVTVSVDSQGAAMGAVQLFADYDAAVLSVESITWNSALDGVYDDHASHDDAGIVKLVAVSASGAVVDGVHWTVRFAIAPDASSRLSVLSFHNVEGYASGDTFVTAASDSPLDLAVTTVNGGVNVADTRPTNLTAVAISPSEVQLSWQDNASNETGFVIERCTGPAVSAEDLIIDNSEAVFTGSWPSSSRHTGFHGSDYQHDANTDKGSKTADYTPSITQNAVYEVYVRYTADSSRASNVPITVFHAGGSHLHTVDQRTGGGQWNLLGSYTLEPGVSHVEIGTGGTDSYVIADAFRCVCSAPAWEQVGTVGPDVTTFVDRGLIQGVMYTYRVKASLPPGDSGYSDEVSATPDPLRAFRQRYGLALDGSEDMGDLSRNGLANIVYFLFGLGDPNDFDVSALTLGPPPAAGLPVLNAQTNGTMTYSYVRHKTQTDYDRLVQTSSNLLEAVWGDINLPATPYRPVSNSTENLDQDYEFCHLFFPVEDGARFIKIQIQPVP